MESNEDLFIRVVEAGSLKAAAEQTGMDPSSVSRKIAALEEKLQVKLLTRSTRRSVPTEAGGLYYNGLRKLADEKAALENAVSGERDIPQGLLRVTAPVDFGAKFVAPVLAAMNQEFEHLQVELILGSHFENIVAENIDVAIRIGRLPDSNLIRRNLGVVPRVIVASREYLVKHGHPAKPSDLADHDFIFYTKKSAQSPIEFPGKPPQSVQVRGRMTVNNVTIIKNLVLAGHGMHLGPYWAYSDEIACGKVIPVLQDYELRAFPLNALYNATTFIPAKIRLFIDRVQVLKIQFGPDCIEYASN